MIRGPERAGARDCNRTQAATKPCRPPILARAAETRFPRNSGFASISTRNLLVKICGSPDPSGRPGLGVPCIHETAVLQAGGPDDRRAGDPAGLENGEQEVHAPGTGRDSLTLRHGRHARDVAAGLCRGGVISVGHQRPPGWLCFGCGATLLLNAGVVPGRLLVRQLPNCPTDPAASRARRRRCC